VILSLRRFIEQARQTSHRLVRSRSQPRNIKAFNRATRSTSAIIFGRRRFLGRPFTGANIFWKSSVDGCLAAKRHPVPPRRKNR
jgi:hypothetical protein